MSKNENYKSLLRTSGLRSTRGRLLLLTALHKAAQPVSVEDLHAQAKSLNLVTVYRTVQSLHAAGLVREVRFKDAMVRYEFAHEHHHHLVCTGCGVVVELPGCDALALEKHVLKQSSRFASVDEHALEFFGTCVRCAKR